ncbi:MAG: hypothetical protein ACI4F8_10310 [Lachnospiraceae bacterium]
MKKYLFTFIVISFLLTGCSSKTEVQETTINNPYEISIDNKMLSYYGNIDDIPKSFEVLNISISNFQNDSNNVLVNNENSIRCISITNKNVITYNQISVGDKIGLIEDAFAYECKISNNYMVIFNGTIEEDPTNQNKQDSWLWITYITDGSQITKIQIYDVKFGREMR